MKNQNSSVNAMKNHIVAGDDMAEFSFVTLAYDYPEVKVTEVVKEIAKILNENGFHVTNASFTPHENG